VPLVIRLGHRAFVCLVRPGGSSSGRDYSGCRGIGEGIAMILKKFDGFDGNGKTQTFAESDLHIGEATTSPARLKSGPPLLPD